MLPGGSLRCEMFVIHSSSAKYNLLKNLVIHRESSHLRLFFFLPAALLPAHLHRLHIQLLHPMRDRQRLIRPALLPDSLRPDTVRQVRPIVLALLQLLPGFLQALLPGLVLEQPPQRRGRDLHPIVQVWLPKGRHAQHLGAKILQLALEIAQALQLFLLGRAALGPAAQAGGFLTHLLELRVQKIVDAGCACSTASLISSSRLTISAAQVC